MQALKENLGSRLTVKIQVDHSGIVRIVNAIMQLTPFIEQQIYMIMTLRSYMVSLSSQY